MLLFADQVHALTRPDKYLRGVNLFVAVAIGSLKLLIIDLKNKDLQSSVARKHVVMWSGRRRLENNERLCSSVLSNRAAMLMD